MAVAEFQQRGKRAFAGAAGAAEGARGRHRANSGADRAGGRAVDLCAVVAGAEANAEHIAAGAEPELVGQLRQVEFQFGVAGPAADIYLPYLAVLPLIAVWSYLLDGLFIGATRAREMRNGMLLTVLLTLPFAWALQPYGNHGLWITFLLFMALRSLTLWAIAWRLNRQDQWLG